MGSSIKVFESSGRFLNYYSLRPDNSQNDTEFIRPVVCQVATDMNDNIYVLIRLWPLTESFVEDYPGKVYVFDCNVHLLHKFSLKEELISVGLGPSLTVNDKNKVLVLRQPRCSQRKPTFEVYLTDVGSFGDGILKKPDNIAAPNDCRTLVTYSVEIRLVKMANIFPR